jgi:hypothetical protein
MAQTRKSGREANSYGHSNAALIASACGARKLRGGCNDCDYQGQLVSLHSAKRRTTKVGTTYETLRRVTAVWGAFAIDGGAYAVWSLPVSDYEVNMKPTKSKGPSKDKVGTVERTVFERSGRLIARVKI